MIKRMTKSCRTTHTSGPWTLILHGNERYPFPLSIRTSNGENWITRDGTVSSLAHARLIAAAPETAAECDRLIEGLRRLLLVCGSTGDALLDFEEQATAFEAATGKMRPGKDVPAACAGSGATHVEYADWVDGEVDAARAALIRHDKGEL